MRVVRVQRALGSASDNEVILRSACLGHSRGASPAVPGNACKKNTPCHESNGIHAPRSRPRIRRSPGSNPNRPRPEFEAPQYKGAGKVKGLAALVTGGDSGIGRAVAVLFADKPAKKVAKLGAETPMKRPAQPEGGCAGLRVLRVERRLELHHRRSAHLAQRRNHSGLVLSFFGSVNVGAGGAGATARGVRSIVSIRLYFFSLLYSVGL